MADSQGLWENRIAQWEWLRMLRNGTAIEPRFFHSRSPLPKDSATEETFPVHDCPMFHSRVTIGLSKFSVPKLTKTGAAPNTCGRCKTR